MRFFAQIKVLVGILVVLTIIGYVAFSSDWFQKRFIYPFPYQSTIYHYASENNVSPFLVAAVIRNESKFMPQARSPKGAMGLMQMMPETGVWVALQLEFGDFEASLLTEPEVNIRFGTWYLASLQKEFYHNNILALAAYNGGRGNVSKWMKKYGWSMAFTEVDQIPFRETREYVEKVLRDEHRYQQLYGR